MSSVTEKLQLWASGWFLRKPSNKQKVCWITPSNEVISYPEPPRANGRRRINQFGQSGKLSPATREQAAASAARNRTNQEAFGVPFRQMLTDISGSVRTELHQLMRVREMQAPPPAHQQTLRARARSLTLAATLFTS